MRQARSLSWDYDRRAFESLQSRLKRLWPALTLRTIDDSNQHRTIIVVSSLSVELPEHVLRMVAAYEERYLLFVLGLANSPRSRVIYITSTPTLPRIVDYYLGLRPGLRAAAAERLKVISVGDPSDRPLTAKILERPLLVERLHRLAPDKDRSVIVPFAVSDLEAELALRLDVPVYGPHPALNELGTKIGSRRAFRDAGLPMPRGREDVRTLDDVVEALVDLQAERPVHQVMLKHDLGVSGIGNATIDLHGATERSEIEERVRALTPEDEHVSAEEFVAVLEQQSGIVEERIEGDDFRSPSVQLRASPTGDVEVLSTHDQILGGRSGQMFLGCTFPAERGYAAELADLGERVARYLSGKGVIGRFAVDFVVRRGERGGWDPFAIEINLRNGGTTHPSLTLLALTEGEYDPGLGVFSAGDVPKHYIATDHLERPEYMRFTPDDVLDVIDAEGLGWDHEQKKGLAFHLLSAVASGGRVGVTAIGDSPEEARRFYDGAKAALDRAAGVEGVPA